MLRIRHSKISRHFQFRDCDLATRFGLLVGMALPLVAALLYRTYDYSLTPDWLNMTRHFGLPFVVIAIGVILYARKRGFDVAVEVGTMHPYLRFLLFCFLTTYWLSSVLVSRVPSFSIGLSLVWAIHMVFGIAVYYLVRTGEPFDARGLAPGMALGLLLLLPLIAWHFLCPPAELGDPYEINWDSAIPGFISARLFGAWTAVVAAVVLGITWFREPGDRHTVLSYSALTLAVGMAVWSGTRAALLGWGVAAVTAFVLGGRPRSPGFGPAVASCCTIAVLLAVALTPYDHPQFMLFHARDMDSAAAFSAGRIEYWMAALRVAALHPLFGTGAGSSFWLVSISGIYHVQPHNALVQFLLTWGAAPTIPALALLFWATWKAHLAAWRRPPLIPVIMMLNCLLAIGLVDGMFHFSRFVMLIFACYGICLGAAARERSGQHPDMGATRASGSALPA